MESLIIFFLFIVVTVFATRNITTKKEKKFLSMILIVFGCLLVCVLHYIDNNFKQLEERYKTRITEIK